MMRCVYLILVAAMIVSCKSQERIDPKLDSLGRATGPVTRTAQRPQTNSQAETDTSPQSMPSGTPEPGPTQIIRGEVLETMDASRYTYVELKLETGDTAWAAIPKAALEVGKPVEIVYSLEMKNFTSRTLDRTFPSIIFGTLNTGETAEPE